MHDYLFNIYIEHGSILLICIDSILCTSVKHSVSPVYTYTGTNLYCYMSETEDDPLVSEISRQLSFCLCMKMFWSSCFLSVGKQFLNKGENVGFYACENV